MSEHVAINKYRNKYNKTNLIQQKYSNQIQSNENIGDTVFGELLTKLALSLL